MSVYFKIGKRECKRVRHEINISKFDKVQIFKCRRLTPMSLIFLHPKQNYYVLGCKYNVCRGSYLLPRPARLDSSLVILVPKTDENDPKMVKNDPKIAKSERLF